MVTASGVPIQIGFNRRFDPAHASVRAAVIDGSVGDVHIAAHHQPRPGAAADRLHQGLRRDVPRHDDPRLRHGPLRHRQRGGRGLRPSRSACRSGDRRGRRRRHCSRGAAPTRTAASPPSTTAARRCMATTSGSRRSARAGMAASENPLSHTGMRRSAAGTVTQTIPYFFLDRYIPSYVEEWKAFVGYVEGGGSSPVVGRRRPGAAGDRPGGDQVARREPPGCAAPRSADWANRAAVPVCGCISIRSSRSRGLGRHDQPRVDLVCRELERLRMRSRGARARQPGRSGRADYVPSSGVCATSTSTGEFMRYSTCNATDLMHPRFAEISDAVEPSSSDGTESCGNGSSSFIISSHQALWRQEVTRAWFRGRRGEASGALRQAWARRSMVTDAPHDIGAAAGWIETGQHVSSLARIRYTDLVDGEIFDANVAYRTCDMNEIPSDLVGFDFNWSSCCFEHLGSLEAGVRLRPARSRDAATWRGVAVHTTELNLSSNDETVVARGHGDLPNPRHRRS